MTEPVDIVDVIDNILPMATSRAPALVADLERVPEAIRDRVVLFRTLIVLAGQLRARMDQRYREVGITTQQAAVLAVVKAATPPVNQGDVARLLGVTQQNVRQLVDALVRKGLIAVRAHPGDRRIKRLVTTRRVGRLFARRNPADFAAVAEWFSVLDDAEVASLLEKLGRLMGGRRSTEDRP